MAYASDSWCISMVLVRPPCAGTMIDWLRMKIHLMLSDRGQPPILLSKKEKLIFEAYQ